jgi:hypothetical protein
LRMDTKLLALVDAIPTQQNACSRELVSKLKVAMRKQFRNDMVKL